MRCSKVSVCLAVLCLTATALAQNPTGSFSVTGDWNVTARDSAGTVQYGAWRITQQSTQLDVVGRWAHIEGLRPSSGTLSENGRVMLIGGPTDGWMETFSGLLSADGSEISGTWSRVEGNASTKGTFVAQRARVEPPANISPTTPATNAPAGAGRPMVEAPGSQTETPTPPASRPVSAGAAIPASTPLQQQSIPPSSATPEVSAPARTESPTASEPAADRPRSTQDMAELENLLAALIEQNQMLIRQSADVRNQTANKDQLLAAQLQRQQRVLKLVERLIHSKVEMEELLELFRRGNRPPQ